MKQVFIIGAQRAGTTFLYKKLQQIKGICLAEPLRPEPKFFLKNLDLPVDIEAYKRQYYKINPETVCCVEKSTSYYEYPSVADKIKMCFPDAKIIFCARNPVDRALSNYRFSKQNGFETRTAADVFINKSAPPAFQHVSVNPFDYIGRGEYARHLRPYYNTFGEESIFITLFEDLVQNDKFDKLLSFLGLEHEVAPSITDKINHTNADLDKYDDTIYHTLQAHYKTHNKEFAILTKTDISAWQDEQID